MVKKSTIAWTAALAGASALGVWAWKKHAAAADPQAPETVVVASGDLESHFVDSGEIGRSDPILTDSRHPRFE